MTSVEPRNDEQRIAGRGPTATGLAVFITNTPALQRVSKNGVTPMNAKDIKLGETYALRRSDVLVRFRVTTIITKRDGEGTKSYAEGYIAEDRKDDTAPKLETVKVAALEGPYQQVAELVEKEKRDVAERKRQAVEDLALQERVRELLYKLTGLPKPKDPAEYHQAFKLDYSGVDISKKALKPLAEALEKLGLPVETQGTQEFEEAAKRREEMRSGGGRR
jgi:hypothetical protein